RPRLACRRVGPAAVSARAVAMPLSWSARRRPRATASDALCFSDPGAPLVAVCGLHGGAGTTTLACLLAEHAAGSSPSGRVLIAEGDARAAELAAHLGASSPLSLMRLAAGRARGEVPAV